MHNDDVGIPHGFHGYCALALPLPAPLLEEFTDQPY